MIYSPVNELASAAARAGVRPDHADVHVPHLQRRARGAWRHLGGIRPRHQTGDPSGGGWWIRDWGRPTCPGAAQRARIGTTPRHPNCRTIRYQRAANRRAYRRPNGSARDGAFQYPSCHPTGAAILHLEPVTAPLTRPANHTKSPSHFLALIIPCFRSKCTPARRQRTFVFVGVLWTRAAIETISLPGVF